MRLVAVRERGVSAEQVPLIGTDPDLFDAFYTEHLEDLQRFVARRVSDRERAADLTADIFLAAIDSAHRYQPRGTPKAWLYGIARVVVAEDRRQGAREQLARRHDLMDPALRRAHGWAGRERVVQNFSLDSMVQRYLTLYDELLSSPSPRHGGERVAAGRGLG